MEHAKELNSRTKYTIIPDFSVILHQDNQTVILTGQEIARLHMDVSTQPSIDVQIPGIKLGDES